MPMLLSIALVLVVVAAVVPAFLPNEYQVFREIEIARPAPELSATLADLRARERWTAWAEREPTATYTYDGSPGEIGASMRWAGDSVGEGTVTLLSVTPGQTIATRLEMKTPFGLTQSADDFTLTPIDAAHTRVRWSNRGTLPYPMRLLAPMFDRMLGPDYARGLERLKTLSETRAIAAAAP
jgi:hypothetical protein